MPESKSRKEFAYQPPPKKTPGPPRLQNWVAPTMVTLLVVGLVWIVVYYVAGDRIPFMVSLGAWNFAIGFGAMVAGLVMSMRWR